MTVTACDTATGPPWPRVLAAVPAAVPLTGVVHAAGILDDAITTSLTPARVETVMTAKADAAWHLHELTAGRGPGHLHPVLLRRGDARVGGPGRLRGGERVPGRPRPARSAAGLAGQSLAWGPWRQPGGMTGHLTAGDGSG